MKTLRLKQKTLCLKQKTLCLKQTEGKTSNKSKPSYDILPPPALSVSGLMGRNDAVPSQPDLFQLPRFSNCHRYMIV
jgi:hypothetical protein